jgi:hypothetical protein
MTHLSAPSARGMVQGSVVLCFVPAPWCRADRRTRRLMAEAAATTRVIVWEPSVPAGFGDATRIRCRTEAPGLEVVTPVVAATDRAISVSVQHNQLREFVATLPAESLVAWIAGHDRTALAAAIAADVVVVDEVQACGSPQTAVQLADRADLVITGSRRRFEEMRAWHDAVVVLPPLGAVELFARERLPASVRPLSRRRPKLAYPGPIDGRLDFELLDAMAVRRPEWQFLLMGRVHAAAPASLARRPNVTIQDRVHPDPRQLARVDVALFPFARGDATDRLSPQELSEALALGLPVVATPLPELAALYGEQGLVEFAGDALAAIHAAEQAMQKDPAPRRAEADRWLARHSWARSWNAIAALIAERQHQDLPTVPRHGAAVSEMAPA